MTVPGKGVLGVVLVGGKSRRMGRPKALLQVAGKTSIEHVVDALKPLADSIVLAGDAEGLESLGLPSVADSRPGAGPLAGMEAALAAHGRERNVIVACDMPCVTPALFRRLLDEVGDFDAAVPEADGRLHPLCAVYSPACLSEITGHLQAGRNKVLDLVAALRLRVVPLDAAGIPPETVLNMNSSEDVAAADAFLRGRGTGD